MYLREVKVGADKDSAIDYVEQTVAIFDRQVLCITNAYNSLLYRKLKIPEFSKLRARLSIDEEKILNSEQDFGCMRIWHYFDFAAYTAADDLGRKRLLLNAVHDILLRAAEHYSWNKSVIEQATQFIRDSNYRVSIPSKKKWRHPDNRLSMQVECRFDLDEFELTGVLSRLRRGEVARYHLGTALPIPDYYLRYQSDAEWVSREQFELHAKYSFRNEIWQCSIDPEFLE